jgi:hypothetical protein
MSDHRAFFFTAPGAEPSHHANATGVGAVQREHRRRMGLGYVQDGLKKKPAQAGFKTIFLEEK